MLPTGSKLLLGGTVLATVAAVVYGLTQEGALGTVGLISAAAALAFLTGIYIYIREADVSAMDTGALTESAAAATPPGASVWPFVAGLGGVLIAVGLVTYPPVFVFGIIALLAATVDWMIQAYAERASADQGFNATIRARIAHPLEFPILAAVGVAILVYSFSRIMLFLSKTSGPAAFGVLAALILAVGFVVAFVPTIRSTAIGVVAAIAAIGLVAGGAAAALEGEREMHHVETTAELAEQGACTTTEETGADENASQSVAAKSSIAAVVTLREDGTLVARNIGLRGITDRVITQRANITNIRFVNETDEPRRLVLDLGSSAEGEEGAAPAQLCTQLVEEGGSQLLTFSIPTPSIYAETPYRFIVPGVDTAELIVEVS
jgi:hypothetical protein